MTRFPPDPTANASPAEAPVAPRRARPAAAEDRLATALKANLARRKAQARARAAGEAGKTDNDNKDA